LKNISAIDAIALMTIYEDDGAGCVYEAKVTIQPHKKRLRAVGYLPGGQWRADVRLDGHASIRTRNESILTERQKTRLGEALRLTLHRVRGPMNLLDGTEHADRAEPVFISAQHLQRVVATGREALASAYFFDETNCELRMVARGDFTIPGEGTVTQLRNAPMADGIIMPILLEVAAFGQNSFVGDKKILSVELKNLQIR